MIQKTVVDKEGSGYSLTKIGIDAKDTCAIGDWIRG